jgi:peptidoglycan/LPS O-acetylase OafA/YrhL
MERLKRLDGLRGMLAVYVMLGHAVPYTDLPVWVRGPLHHGEAAVDVFFALSGMVVINSLERFGGRAGPFLTARAWRLLPVYFFSLALAVGLLFAGSPLPAMPWVTPASNAGLFWAMGLPARFFSHLAAHVLLLQGVIPQGALPWAYITLLGPAWSLSTEWQFYVFAPLAMRVCRGRVGLAFLLLAMTVAYRGLVLWLPEWWQFSRAFLPDAAEFFALGLVSSVWLRDGKIWPLISVFWAVCLLGLESGEVAKIVTPSVWLAALAAQRWGATWGMLLDLRAVQFLGEVSYPLYLLNAPVQRAAAMVVAPLAGGDEQLFTCLWLPLAVLGPVLAAWIVHMAVEVPLMRGWSARRYRPSRFSAHSRDAGITN